MKYAECVGCGYCCVKTICEMGRLHYNVIEGICPALKWDDDAKRHWCQLVINDPPKSENEFPYIGAGCSSSMMNDWRIEIKDRTVDLKRK